MPGLPYREARVEINSGMSPELSGNVPLFWEKQNQKKTVGMKNNSCMMIFFQKSVQMFWG